MKEDGKRGRDRMEEGKAFQAVKGWHGVWEGCMWWVRWRRWLSTCRLWYLRTRRLPGTQLCHKWCPAPSTVTCNAGTFTLFPSLRADLLQLAILNGSVTAWERVFWKILDSRVRSPCWETYNCQKEAGAEELPLPTGLTLSLGMTSFYVPFSHVFLSLCLQATGGRPSNMLLKGYYSKGLPCWALFRMELQACQTQVGWAARERW